MRVALPSAVRASLRCALSCLVAFCAMLPARSQLVRVENTTLTLPADLPSATGYTTENALTQPNGQGGLVFSLPMCTAFPPGETNRLFVAERGGTIQIVTNLSSTPAKGATPYLSLTSLLGAGETLRTDGENGFLSLVFHPNFATNGWLFVYYSMQDSAGVLHQRLHRVTMASPAANSSAIVPSTTPGGTVKMLTIRDQDTNHNGGDLHFGADGYLYLSLGDEGGGGDNRNNARFINQRLDPVGTTNRVERTGFWGQLIRLDVNSRPENLTPNAHVQNSASHPSAVNAGTYKVPADNPFIGYTRWHSVTISAASVRTEIYATGLRNPFRWSFDPPTGRLFLADVGQGAYEEINLIAKGNDMGWSWREGLHEYNSPPAPADPPAPPAAGSPPGTGFSRTDPIYEYDRSTNPVITGTSVTGGMVYRGSRLTELFGDYVFTDYNSGFIVALREQTNGTWIGRRLATLTGISDFGIDPRNGDTLICNLNNNTVRRLARTGTSGTNPPALLSQTGAFSNLATLTPHAGIVDYEPNVSFWSDNAIKSRWFAIKNTTSTVGFSANGNWTLPTGMIWIKHFEIDVPMPPTDPPTPPVRRRLETRFIVKTASDIYGITYKWNAAQTDADLVPEGGVSEAIPGSNPAQIWRYPSRSECRTCHTPIGGFALSFNTRQLNRAHPFGAQTQNQITALSGAGYFTTPPANVHSLPAFSPASDTGKSLEHRVRSYLAVNCVQCHQPGGGATGNWDARPTTPTDAAGLINGMLANTFGDPANRFAVKGDAAHSMVVKRLQGSSVPRMPPLGTNVLDAEAIQLLSDWITVDLPSRQSLAEWQIAQFGSTTAPAAALGADPDNDGLRNDFEFLARSSPQNSADRWSLGLQTVGLNYQLTFPQVANRSVVIETSTDLQTWALWDVPGNAPIFSSTTQPRMLIGPMTGPQRFFRPRFAEQ